MKPGKTLQHKKIALKRMSVKIKIKNKLKGTKKLTLEG